MKGIIFIGFAVGFMLLVGVVFGQSPTPTVTPSLKSSVLPSATPSFSMGSDKLIFPHELIGSTGNSYVDAMGIPIEPGKFVVKFKESPAITGAFTNIKSINELNQRYNIQLIERMFKGFESANKRVEEKKKEFPVRAKRAPKNAKVPKLENIYEFTVSKEENIFRIVKEYSKNPNVEYAEPVFKEIQDFIVNDPHFIRNNPTELWNIFKIQADLAWDYFDSDKNGVIDGNEKKPGEGVIVAIVDWEFDVSHEDLKDNLWKPDITAVSGLHGTHMGGTVAATGDNRIGVVGVAWGAKLMPTGGANPEKIIEAADLGADILADSSPVFGDFSKVMIDAVDYATAQGVVVVASAGNANVDTYTQAPSQAESAISVASSDYFDYKADSSSWGSKIDVIAPGDYILSTVPGNSYSWEQGTSFAVPHVAGVAALLLSKNPDLTVEQIRQILRTSADDLVDPLNDGKDYSGWDIYSGYGRLNAKIALESELLCEANIKSPTVNYVENKYLWSNPVDPRRFFYDAKVLVNNKFDVRGIADSPLFSHYILELGEGENPKEWGLVKRGETIVGNNVLGSVDLIGRSNEAKTLRLQVFLKNGRTCEDRVIIQPTFALITSPVEGNLYFPSWTDVLNFVVPPFFPDEEELLILYPGIRGFVNYPNVDEWSLWYQIQGSEEKMIEKSNLLFPLQGSFDLRLRDNALLEKWNPEIPDGDMKIILKVKTKDGIEYKDEVNVNYDGTHFPYQEGWPRKIEEWGYATVSPVIYDVDGKNGKEIITGNSYGLYLFNSDGTIYNEKWPLICDFTRGVYFCNQNIDSSPTVGDVDGDGLAEIGIKSKDWSKEYIHLFNLQGTEMEGWPKEYSFTGSIGFMEDIARSTVVFSDINNDGVLDMIYGILGLDGIEMDRVFAYDGKGNLLWSQITDDRVVKNVVVGDLDGDGMKEIVVMSEESGYVLSHEGKVIHKWAFKSGGSFINPVLADVDNNGKVEIIAGDQRGEQAGTVFIWNKDGSIFSKMSINIINEPGFFFRDMYQPLAWNLDEDQELEIFVAASFYEIIDTGKGYANTPIYTYFFAFENDGRLIDGWPKKYDIYDIGDTYFPGILADVDGDKLANLIIGSWFSLGKAINVFDTKGDLVKDPRFPFRVNHIYYSSPAAGDLDDDGDLELVFMENAVDHIYVWDLPFSVSNMEWPMFQHDPQHTGLYGYVQPEITKKFIRGDPNEDGKVDLSDAIVILRYLFQGGTTPKCLDSADANDDGKVDLSDAVYTLNYLFQGGRKIPPPFDDVQGNLIAGEDPTLDELRC